jgi:D-inositol-3-phosphate glycosyltransferase
VKIAMISEHASPLAGVGGVDAGGQNVHVSALSCALAERGHEVVVYTRQDGPDLAPRVRLAPGVTVEHVVAGPTTDIPKDHLSPYMEAFGAELARRWRVEPPDVAHAHFWMSGLAALGGTAGTAIPVVQTFHALGTVKRRWQGADDTSPAERIAMEEMLGRSVDQVIATCTDERRELAAMGVPADRIRTVPCGVDTALFTPAGPSAPRGGRPRLLMLTRLVPRKGVEDAITALAEVPDAELLVVGGPPAGALDLDPEARRLNDLCVEHGLADRVQLLGRLPHGQLPPLIRSSDLVLSVPWYEPFGIVVLEAMACAVPVVSTAVGGMLDTVEDGRTGRLVPPHAPGRLAEAVRALLADPDTRRAMGAAGSRRVQAGYSWSAVAAATEARYTEVLAGAWAATSAEVAR